MSNSFKIKPYRGWVKFKYQVRQMFKSKKRKEADRIAAANSFWSCFSEEEKKQQMKYFYDLIHNSDYCRTQIK